MLKKECELKEQTDIVSISKERKRQKDGWKEKGGKDGTREERKGGLQG